MKIKLEDKLEKESLDKVNEILGGFELLEKLPNFNQKMIDDWWNQFATKLRSYAKSDDELRSIIDIIMYKMPKKYRPSFYGEIKLTQKGLEYKSKIAEK